MNGGNGLRGCWLTALVLLTLVALVASHLMLLLLHSNYPDEQKKTVQKRPVRVRSSSPLSLSESPKFWQIDDAPEDTSVLQEPTTTSSSSDGLAESSIVATKDDPASQYSDTDDPFSPPLYGYDSMSELQGRGNRFPTIQQRVQVYMSNWYLPPCKKGSYSTRDEDAEDGLVHYRRVITPSSNHQSLVLVQEVTSAATPVPYPRTFLLDSNSTLGKLHFVSRDKMHPDMCDSEYCEDILQHWIPAMDRVVVLDDRQNHPVFFQFSDEELSRAYSILYQDLEKYPNLPHLKKSRLSLLSHTGSTSDTAHCSSIPRPILPTMTADADIPAHLHPIIYKLKTNRHYGMISSILPQDIPWSQKKNQAIFRGTLTGLLPANSRFSLSTRSQRHSTLSEDDAHMKCLELDRCRLVYKVNQFYNQQEKEPFLVDAKLVLPQLQHTDIPESIHNVTLFGNRMTKSGLLQYKAIIMLEGNDAGTGFKWGLFSNSVIMTTAKLNFTSWAMEELLEPWVHYIPLDPNNFELDVHVQMQWVLDHDTQAQEIARRGSLWIRDLLLHPDAVLDDEEISDDMVRRYMAHFLRDDDLDPTFDDATAHIRNVEE